MKTLQVYWLAWKGFGDELYPCDHMGATVVYEIESAAALALSKEDLLNSVAGWLPEELNSPNTPWSVQTLTLELDNE